MKTVLCAGYPKSGNTLLSTSLLRAGGVQSQFDIYEIRRSGLTPAVNPIFSADTCCIKTHDHWRPSQDLHTLYFGEVTKVVVITRNPLDTLLSGINFFRVMYAKSGSKMPDIGQRSLSKLMPGFQVNESFLADFTLDKLRDRGMLDTALRNFGENGTVFLNFYHMSGPWSDFRSSYDHSGISLLKISFEELESISIGSTNDAQPSQELLSLSSFLDIDALRLKQGFATQRQSVINKINAQSINSANFFNKASSGYWRNYLSPKACKNFADKYYPAIVRNGYEYLIDEIC